MKAMHGTCKDINNCEIVTLMNEHSYAAFIGTLSNIFMKAHASSLFRTKPYQAAIIVNEGMATPIKGQPESSLDRLIQITKRFKEPRGGIEISIFLGETSRAFPLKSKYGLKHTVSQCWKMQQHGNKSHLTINLPPSTLNSGENKVRYFTEKDLETPRFKKKFISYDTPIKEALNSLDNSAAHICYQGGTAWLSVCMGVPTVIVHDAIQKNKLHLKHKLFGQDLGGINILQNNEITYARTHPAEHHTSLKKLKSVLQDLL